MWVLNDFTIVHAENIGFGNVETTAFDFNSQAFEVQSFVFRNNFHWLVPFDDVVSMKLYYQKAQLFSTTFWRKLMGWKETAKQLELLGKYFASVGWHDTAKYPDGTQVAVAAVSAEYGNVKMNVPPRPIVRPTIEQQSAEWSRQAALGIKAVAMGTRTAEQVITALGELAA